MAQILGRTGCEAPASRETPERALAMKDAQDDLRTLRSSLGVALLTCRSLSENEVLSELDMSNLRALSERIESLKPRVLLLIAGLDHTST